MKHFLLLISFLALVVVSQANPVLPGDSTRLFLDSQGRVIERVDYVNDGVGGYRQHLRKMYTYHAETSKVTETTVQFFKANTWINVQKSTLTYSPKGDTLAYVVQIAKGTQWENQKQVIYEYDSNGMSAKTLALWEEGEWNNATRYLMQYIPSEQRYAVNGEFVWMSHNWVGGKGIAIPTVDTGEAKRNRK